MSYRRKILIPSIILCLIMGGLSIASSTLESYAAPNVQPPPTPDSISVFEDVTANAGVAFNGAQFGAAWGDYDNDGWVDLFANNHYQDNPNVYRNNSGSAFIDIYGTSGMYKTDPHGASWGDYDNDGDLDLYLTTGRLKVNPLFENQGDGIFLDRAVEAGVEDLQGRGRTANWIDYDNDGDLDLFTGNAIRADGPDKLYRNNGDKSFSDVSTNAGLNSTLSTNGNVWGDYDDDGDLDVVLTGGEQIRLHRNNGDGTFTPVTTQANILGFEARSWAADFGDYDNDGDLDLYIARGNYNYFDNITATDTALTYTFKTSGGEDGFDVDSSSWLMFDLLTENGDPLLLNQVYLGASKTHPPSIPFSSQDVSLDYGQPTYTSGVDAGLYIWQDGPGGTWHLRASNIFGVQGRVSTDGAFSNLVEVSVDPPTAFNSAPKYNRLYQNQGDGTFSQVGFTAGVASSRQSRTGTWLDYNNDGWLDLYVVNSGNVAIGNEANHLYRNNGDGTFTDMAAEAGVEAITPGLGDCAAWADYDHNGFLDLFVVTGEQKGYLSGPHKLYRNLGNNNHWLEINLTGVQSNRQGIGATVEVTAGGVTQRRDLNNGSHYVCQNSAILHFGLGAITQTEAITITWPSGQVQTFHNQPANQILTFIEGESDPSPTILSTNPNNEATDVFLNAPIIVDFSTMMDTNSVNYMVTPPVTLIPTWNNDNTRLTLAHGDLFIASTAYTVTISGQNMAGNSLAAGSVSNPWRFTTGVKSISEADLAIAQAHNSGVEEIKAGEGIGYTLTITNAGPTTPVTATIVNLFNNEAALAEIDGPGCAWSSGSTVVTCTVANLSNTASHLTLVVTTNTSYRGPLTSTATITTLSDDVIDPNMANNNAPPVTVMVIENSGGSFSEHAYLPIVFK